MNNWLRIAHEWLLPRHCLLCLGPASDINLCRACRSALPRIQNPCRGCGAPLAAGQRCARCLNSPPAFYRVHIPYLYAGPSAALIHALKFRYRLSAAAVLGTLLAEQLDGMPAPRPQLIVPVPLHPKRQRKRGFNQAMEIARVLSLRLKIPLAPRVARRIRATAAQSTLSGAKLRRVNMRGAFVAESRTLESTHHLAILDDVVTTGATVNALALALKSAGVNRIELWSFARAGEF